MERKKLFRLILGVSLLVIAVLGLMVILANNDPKETTEEVSSQRIKEAAQASLASFEDWRGPTLEESYIFYDLNKSPSAYLFNVSDYYGKAGYIVISATTKLDPIIEISSSAETPVSKILVLVNDLTLGSIYEPGDVRIDYIYLGGQEYYARLTLREGEDVSLRHYKLERDKVSQVDEEVLLNKQADFLILKEESAPANWEKLLGRPTD